MHATEEEEREVREGGMMERPNRSGMGYD